MSVATTTRREPAPVDDTPYADDYPLSTTQAAHELGVHPSRILQFIKAGRLASYKDENNRWKILARDLESVRERRQGRPPVEGARLRTDRLNASLLKDERVKLDADMRKAVSEAVKRAQLTNLHLTTRDMLVVAQETLAWTGWDRELLAHVSYIVLFGREPQG